jgi:hypothetical protein
MLNLPFVASRSNQNKRKDETRTKERFAFLSIALNDTWDTQIILIKKPFVL